MEFVGGHRHMSGIGQHNLCLVESLVGLVDDDIVEHAGLGIFLLYIKVDIGDAVVEDAFGDFHRRLAFAHGDDELPQTALGTGREGILEIERYSGGEDAEYNDGPHDAEEGDAGGLHGRRNFIFELNAPMLLKKHLARLRPCCRR